MQAQINGNEVFYTTNGQGRPMLLMHGGSGLDHTYFRPWLDTLSDQVQLIYYDQLGQGRSTRPESYEGISMATWAEEADALRASLGHEHIILLGHSFGGFIAQEYALGHDDHLDGLILCDTAPVLDYQDVIMANAQSRGTPEQVQAVIEGLSAPVADDARFQQLLTTILPLYFNTYDPKVGAKIDEATEYSAGAFNQGMAWRDDTTGSRHRRRGLSASTRDCPTQSWLFLRKVVTSLSLRNMTSSCTLLGIG